MNKNDNIINNSNKKDDQKDIMDNNIMINKENNNNKGKIINLKLNLESFKKLNELSNCNKSYDNMKDNNNKNIKNAYKSPIQNLKYQNIFQ
jgi:hypothetical protein